MEITLNPVVTVDEYPACFYKMANVKLAQTTMDKMFASFKTVRLHSLGFFEYAMYQGYIEYILYVKADLDEDCQDLLRSWIAHRTYNFSGKTCPAKLTVSVADDTIKKQISSFHPIYSEPDKNGEYQFLLVF